MWLKIISSNSGLLVLSSTRATKSSGNTPGIWFFEFVVQRLEFLLLLLHREFGGIACFEESRGEFDQPLRVDCCYFSHVLFGGQDELVIDAPVGLSIEHGGRGVDEDLLLVYQSTVAI